MNPLQSFYNNETQREAVKEFMIACLKELAVEKTFAGENTNGIKEAREIVDNMFDKLEAEYGVKKPTFVNDAR